MFRRLAISLLLFVIAATALAGRPTDHDETDSLDARLDTLLHRVTRQVEHCRGLSQIGRTSVRIYIKGTSQSQQSGALARLLYRVLPFETDTTHTTAIEAICEANYQYPCPMQFSQIALSTNARRRGSRILKEAYQLAFPMYSMRRQRDLGSNKSYTLPFSTDGLPKYQYEITDTLDSQIRIDFSPLNRHHTLLTGHALVDTLTYNVVQLSAFDAHIDFGLCDFTLYFGEDPKSGLYTLLSNDVTIYYRLGKARSTNNYIIDYTYNELILRDEIDSRKISLDVSDIYQTPPLEAINFDSIRPISLSPIEDSLLSTPSFTTARNRQRTLYERLPEHLFGSTRLNPFGTDLKIYGPLHPAAIGYDHSDGLSIRQRVRWSHLFDNQQSLLAKVDLGWCFGIHEGRYRFDLEWLHHPERRSGLHFTARNHHSGFSSKFEDVVNAGIRARDSIDVKLDELGVDFFHRYEFKLEHSWELRTGLMLFGGANYNYRSIVRSGQHAVPQEHLDELVHRHYSDFSPFLRLEWTPRQFYRMEGRQKLYIGSSYPTFSLEFVRSIPNVMNSSSNYGRVELDVQQRIALDRIRSLSYHVSGGHFMFQEGEYFINYNYFSRSQYPSLWEDHIGGTFRLLDDYWYSSSPGYVQAHLMYETPFLLLHAIRPLSRFVIKERIYLSNLWADGKNSYSEMGYGFGNNYFNFGAFFGFVGFFQDLKAGVKATIVIDSHL